MAIVSLANSGSTEALATRLRSGAVTGILTTIIVFAPILFVDAEKLGGLDAKVPMGVVLLLFVAFGGVTGALCGALREVLLRRALAAAAAGFLVAIAFGVLLSLLMLRDGYLSALGVTVMALGPAGALGGLLCRRGQRFVASIASKSGASGHSGEG